MPARSTASKSRTDAIALLKADHGRVRKLLSELTTTRARGMRRDLLAEVAVETRVHARIEEEIFYPAYQGAAKSKEDQKLFLEATEEHGLVHHFFPLVEETNPTDEEFGARAKVLKDLIERHAEEEEEELLPRARRLLGQKRLNELDEELMARKETLLAEAKARSSRR